MYDDEGGRHQAFYSPVRDTYVMGTLVKQHERIQVEQSLKYSQKGAENLWNMAGLIETACWTKGNEHGEWTNSFVYNIRELEPMVAHPYGTCSAWHKPPPRLTGDVEPIAQMVDVQCWIVRHRIQLVPR